MQECLGNAADVTIEIKLRRDGRKKYETKHEQHMQTLLGKPGYLDASAEVSIPTCEALNFALTTFGST